MASDNHQTPLAHEPGSAETCPQPDSGSQGVSVDKDNHYVPPPRDNELARAEREPSPLEDTIEPAVVETSRNIVDKGKGKEVETATGRDVVQDSRGNEEPAPALPVARPQFVPEQPYNTTVLPTNHDLLHHLPPDSRRTTKTKLALSLFGACLGICILGLAGALLSINTVIYNYGHSFTSAAYCGFAVGAVAFLWNTTELVVYAFRVSRTDRFRGIHPGGHVALHLLLTLGSGAGLALAIMTVIRVKSTMDWCESHHRAQLFGDREICDSVLPVGPSLANDYLYALLGLYVGAIIVHFVLFVWACVEVHLRVQVQEVYVLPPPTAGPPQVYMAPAMTAAAAPVPASSKGTQAGPPPLAVPPNEKGPQRRHGPQRDNPPAATVDQEKIGIAQ